VSIISRINAGRLSKLCEKYHITQHELDAKVLL